MEFLSAVVFMGFYFLYKELVEIKKLLQAINYNVKKTDDNSDPMEESIFGWNKLKPIFPTLAFRDLSSAKSDLLYYRIGQDFRASLLEAI